MTKSIEEAVEEIVNSILVETDKELVAVEYVREKDWYLRVFIDKPNGVDLDDCQEVSLQLEKILDEKDLIKGSYILEVSSPGLDRELKKPKDFAREKGKAIDVSLFAPIEISEGKKLITGILENYDGEYVTIDGKAIPMNKVSKINLHIDF